MTKTKTIEAWLIVDWKKGKTRTRATEPAAGDFGRTEHLAKIEVEVRIPEPDVPSLSVELDVPEPKIRAATLDALDDDDLPAWTDVANEVVSEHEDEVKALSAAWQVNDDGEAVVNTREGMDRTDELVDRLTTRVLTSVDSYPKPDNVRDYLFDAVKKWAAADAEPGDDGE